MTEEEALALLESLTVGERKEIPLEDFAWPEERKFPVDSQEHLDACAKLIGHAPEAEQPKIKRNAIRIAKKHGFTLPQSWQDEKQESAASVVDAGSRPKKKIGTLPISWLEYGARSLNERIYPQATCDAIFESAQQEIAKGLANLQQPPTTYTSHEDANGNVNLHLVGAPVKVWQDGPKFWAHIDIADTSVGHDILGLVEGSYLKSGSMRVAGVKVIHDPNYDMPLVVPIPGAEVKFLGIDLTTRPGLDKVAHIPQVLYESNGQEVYSDVFTFECLSLESENDMIPLYQQIILSGLQEAFPSKAQEAHGRIHDHLAGVLDEVMGAKHGSESARLKALIEGQLDEAGRAIAKKHADRLIAAHDESAKACAMECVGCYAPSDTDNDGDNPAVGFDPDNDGESAHQEGNKTVTEEEMLAALKAKGFQIEAPKTEAEKKLDEQAAEFKRLLAEQDAKIKLLMESAQPTQRQTLANSSQLEESNLQPEVLYQEGDYLKGDLRPTNWRALANPAVPWPKDLHPKTALKELAPFLTHRLLQEEATAQGRSLELEIGLGGNL